MLLLIVWPVLFLVQNVHSCTAPLSSPEFLAVLPFASRSSFYHGHYFLGLANYRRTSKKALAFLSFSLLLVGASSPKWLHLPLLSRYSASQ
jgi:hypothetical protein